MFGGTLHVCKKKGLSSAKNIPFISVKCKEKYIVENIKKKINFEQSKAWVDFSGIFSTHIPYKRK